MRFACDSCGAQYMIADEKVGARGVKVKCKKCGNMIVVKPAPEAAAASVPAAADTSASTGYGASAGMSAGGFGEATTQQQAPQGELGGAFSSMFASGQEQAPQQEAPAANGYSNGNHGQNDNNAFGFQSSYGSSGGETDLALGSLEATQTPASTTDRGGERVWYVAIEDAQVGPVNLAEIEERWDNKEVDEDTLVWKAGMADWIPLVDVAELAYLITERPQASRGVARPSMASAASLGGGMQTSGYGGPQEMADEPSWKPSAASALSSLVQEELVAKKPEKEEPASPPKGMEGIGIPNLGASDIFGSGNGAGTPITMGQQAPAPAADPFAGGGSPAWSVPSSRRSGSGTGTKVIIGLLAIAVLGIGGFVVHMSMKEPTVVVREVPAQPPPPQPVAEAKPAVDPNAPPAPPPIPVQPTPKPDDDKLAKGKSKAHSEATGDPKPTKEKTPKKGKDEVDPFEQVTQAPSVKEKLERDDIIDGVKANGSKLGPCVTAARSKNEIQAGRVQFVLDWTINPNGSVTAARLKGPPDVMNTSLPSCFSRVMGSWKFAASKTGAPISNFPLPITVQ